MFVNCEQLDRFITPEVLSLDLQVSNFKGHTIPLLMFRIPFISSYGFNKHLDMYGLNNVASYINKVNGRLFYTLESDGDLISGILHNQCTAYNNYENHILPSYDYFYNLDSKLLVFLIDITQDHVLRLHYNKLPDASNFFTQKTVHVSSNWLKTRFNEVNNRMDIY